VECVERGELSQESTRALVKRYCQPLLDEGADSIVLGCTHYPLLKSLIQEVVGADVVLIDTGAAVANQLKSRLLEQGLLADVDQIASINFWSNSDSANAENVIAQLWGEPINVSHF
jgi:glutamate racemase